MTAKTSCHSSVEQSSIRARWSGEPAVHVLPHWNWSGREGQSLTVSAYANADEVELLVNGHTIVTEKVPPSGIVTTTAPYEPGTIEARGYRDGTIVATATRTTTGAPAGLALRAVNDTCAAGGHDVAIVRIAVVDADGEIVPDACPVLDVSADRGATVLGTGNGSPADHVPAASPRRPAFNGLALAIVRSPREPGPFTVTITGAGVGTATVDIEAR